MTDVTEDEISQPTIESAEKKQQLDNQRRKSYDEFCDSFR